MLAGALHSVQCFWRAVLCWLWHVVDCVRPDSCRLKSVSGQVVLVTGAASGLGRLVACRMALLGAHVVAWDINQSGLAETVRLIKKLGGGATCYCCDVTERNQVYETARKVKDRFGKVDILINNAGIVAGKNLLDLPDQTIENTFKVNILSHFWTVKAFLPEMLEARSGHIVTISSLAGLQGLAQLTDYCSSKFASNGFYESLSVELKALGHDEIRTTCICPFFINTGMFEGAESKIVPFLEPERVADRIVRAIRLNEDQVIVPGWLHYLFYLKLSFNYMTLYWIGNGLHLVNVMQRFRGRR